MSSRYRRFESWLDARPAVEFLLLALLPGVAFGASQLWLSNTEITHAAILGSVFGLTFATITVLGRRIIGR